MNSQFTFFNLGSERQVHQLTHREAECYIVYGRWWSFDRGSDEA